MSQETIATGSSIKDRVKLMITDQFMLPVNAVQDDSTLESLECDSLDVIEIIMSLEEEFGISIDEDEDLKLADASLTISGIADFVEKKLKNS